MRTISLLIFCLQFTETIAVNVTYVSHRFVLWLCDFSVLSVFLAQVAYIFSALCFIMSLAGLSKQVHSILAV